MAISAAVGMLPEQPYHSCAHDAPRRVPLERWDVANFQKVSPNSLDAQFGSFLQDIDSFDASIFGVSRWVAILPGCKVSGIEVDCHQCPLGAHVHYMNLSARGCKGAVLCHEISNASLLLVPANSAGPLCLDRGILRSGQSCGGKS